MVDPEAPYRIGPVLGRGAVAAVHEVVDGQGRRFAGKLLHASRDGDAAAAARFAQEAEILDGLRHPHLVGIYGMAEGVDAQGLRRSFLRMDLVEGEGLEVWIAREAPFDEARALEFARQISSGLAYAHARGIVHRDLKPANILVDESQATPCLRIADFGMARASSLSGLDAGAMTVLGTPDYMAPESVDPLAVDARADLYALGCILFEMLTGKVPFRAATPMGVLRAHRELPLPAMPGEFSAPTRALVESLMAKSPADRPPSAEAVLRRIEAIASGVGTSLLRLEGGSACASCGQPLVDRVAVCMHCGLPAVTLEKGRQGVLVTGPGEVGDKLDANLREKLRAWLEANPQLGLAGGKWLDQKIPRLPVVFVAGVSERSAAAIVASLEALGFDAKAFAGSALKQPEVRSKARKLAGRIMLVALGSTAGIWQQGAVVAGVMGVVGIGAMVGVTAHSAKAVTRKSGRARAALSEPMRRALSAVEALVPTLDEARHRHGLRAIVRRTLALAERSAVGSEAETELAAAMTRAAAGTAALARIDANLRSRDLNASDDDTRQLLLARDQAAGQLLALAGDLERLDARAGAATDGALDDEDLVALRQKIEALEEVESL